MCCTVSKSCTSGSCTWQAPTRGFMLLCAINCPARIGYSAPQQEWAGVDPTPLAHAAVGRDELPALLLMHGHCTQACITVSTTTVNGVAPCFQNNGCKARLACSCCYCCSTSRQAICDLAPSWCQLHGLRMGSASLYALYYN